MRTNEEIVSRINERNELVLDLLGAETGDLMMRLPFEIAKQFLDGSVNVGDWSVLPRDRDSLVAEMLDYMPFAWDKANDCSGLSASRSMSHFMAWTWLAGDDFGDLLNYEFYGKDNLVRICEHYGWDANKWDDGERTNG
jgi:hypothetical protein